MQNKLIKSALMIGFFSFYTAQAAIISKIEISGLNAISRGTVLSYLPVEVGDNYNQQISSQIIRTLHKTQFFKDVEVGQNNQILQINVLENPSIKFIDVLNYSDKVIDQESLDKILQSMSLVQGKIFNQKRLRELVSQLKANYIARGYYNAKFSEKVEVDDNNRVAIEIDIDEGKIARIKSMRINNSQAYSEEKLLKLFKIGEPDFALLNYFTEKDHYSKLALDAGIEALKSLYLNSGYLDIKIIHAITELSADKQSINIDIGISEGQQYSLGKVNFSGNLLDQSAKDLRALVLIKTGDIFERKKIIQGAQKITDIFTNKGYAFSVIDAVPAKNPSSYNVDVNINIALNQRVYVNRITITGNTRTQDDVIRREIKIAEGGVYSNADLNKSIGHIKRLGYFADVKMEVSKVAGFKDKINLHFTVEETKTGQFTVGLSQSSEGGVSFNLGIQERNFLGTGNVLNATLSNSKAVKEVAFYFSDPYFTEDGHSISYGAFSKSIDGSELEASQYKIDENGLSLGYGIPITENTRIGTQLKISTRDIECGHQLGGTNGPLAGTTTVVINNGVTRTQTVDADDFTGRGFETAQCGSGDEIEIKASVNWSSNTLDSFNFPTDGEKIRLSLDLALPIADFRYYKLNASHKSYRPLTNNVTWSINSKVGLGGGYSGKQLPFFERYYGGGSSSVRGFNFNSLGPTYPDGKAQGGKLSLLAGTSLISKLGFIDDSKNMRISAFIDAGSISDKSFDADDVRASTGVAFTWLTPIGPLGFYAAKPILSKTGDDVKTFDFSIGNIF